METTQDGFLDNAITVEQPAKGAHRAGLDAVLLAASVGADAEGILADFGSGAGVAALATLHRAHGLSAVLVERDDTMAALAQNSLRLNAGLADRAEVLKADLAARGRDRLAAGLTDNRFDWVIANPPYNAAQSHQPSPDVMRKSAHSMHHKLLDDWVETARVTLCHKGALRFILRPANLPEILSALHGFGHIHILPVAPRWGDSAHRIIVGAQKGRRDPLQILPQLVLHDEEGRFTPQAQAIMRGKNPLPIIPAG